MNRKQSLWLLPVLLWSAAGWAEATADGPCGMTGTLKDRMKECGGVMKLVTIDKDEHVIKMDHTGLLWGDLLEGTYTFEQAQTACNNVTPAQGYPIHPRR